MRNYPIATDFMKQFRQEDIAYPGNGEKRYSNFFFRQFAGSQKETTIIDISLTDHMSDEKIISQLFEKLRKKDLPDFTRLLCFMQALQKKVFSYANEEPYTSQYYRQLLPVLEQCTSLIYVFHEQIQKDLLNKLEIHIRNKPNSGNKGYFNSGDIDIILSGIERYSRQMQKYFTHFINLLNREADNCHCILVTSRIEQYLLELVDFIERIILDTAVTSEQLEKWQMKLIDRETRELYN